MKSKNSHQSLPSAQSELTPSSLLKVGEAAKFLGVSIDTLRRWEEKGVLTPFRTPGSTRLYTGKQLLEINPSLKFIRNPNFNRSLSRKIFGLTLTYFSYTAAFFTVIAIVYFATASTTKFLPSLPFNLNFANTPLRSDGIKIKSNDPQEEVLSKTGTNIELNQNNQPNPTNPQIPSLSNTGITNNWQAAYEACESRLKKLENSCRK